jgi:hypothetical protein
MHGLLLLFRQLRGIFNIIHLSIILILLDSEYTWIAYPILYHTPQLRSL